MADHAGEEVGIVPAALRHRDFRLFWGGVVLSGLGSQVTTVALALKLEGEAIYVASKAAVLALTEVLAKELARWGITVNAVGPVPVETDLIQSVPRDKIERLLSQQAIPRMGTCDDIANVIDFYFKPESGFITGQHLLLGGL